MSKLIDMLEKAGDQPAEPMGFGLLGSQPKSAAAMAVLTEIDADALASPSETDGPGPDGVIVTLPIWNDGRVETAAKALDGQVWGARVGRLTADQASKLAEAGADFVVLDSTDADAAVLDVESIAIILSLPEDADEELTRAMGELPSGATLLNPAIHESPLTLGAAVDLQRVVGRLGKPFVATIEGEVSAADLGILRNIGISGLIVEASRVAAIKSDIDTLPSPKTRRRSHDALVPRSNSVAEVEAAADDDYEEDF